MNRLISCADVQADSSLYNMHMARNPFLKMLILASKKKRILACPNRIDGDQLAYYAGRS